MCVGPLTLGSLLRLGIAERLERLVYKIVDCRIERRVI